MKYPTLAKFILLFALALPVAYAQAAEIAGRVLVAVGEVTAIRQAREIRLTSGSSVESGDRIVTGAESNAQIRFTDESIVALRPKTEFSIDEYHFAGEAEASNKGFFGLLKGGFRTLTGAIGKVNRDAYKVNTHTATIGIRGTHYNALLCRQQSCIGDDGQPSRDGLYGGVFDGRIGLDNQAGTREFGKDEFFYVADANTLPIRLIAPPTFLRDKLEGQIKAKSSTTPGSSPSAKDSSVKAESKPETAPVSTTLSANYVAAENLGEKGTSSVVSPQTKAVVIVAHGLNNARNNEPDGGIIGPYGTSFHPEFGPGNILIGYKSSYPSGNTFHASLGTATVLDTGTAAQAGNLNWGRWSGAGSHAEINFGFPISLDGANLHYIYGDPATNLPTSGIVNYTPVGWTTPTDAVGTTGQLLSGGTINVNFASAVANLSGLTVGMNNTTYTLGGSASFSPTQGQFFHASTEPASGISGTASLSCRGANCGLDRADFLGVLAGQNAAGIGLSYGIYHSTPNTPPGGRTGGITGAVGYSR